MSPARLLFVAMAIVVTVGAVAVGALHRRPSKIAAHPVAAVAPKPPLVVRADGRVVTAEGGRVTVGAEATGTVDRVLVREGTVVRAGDLLVVFRGGEETAMAEEAHARTREAHASVRFLEQEVRRTKALVASGALAKRALDKVVQERDAARAQRAAVGASARRFVSAVRRTRIVAPIAGTIIMRSVEPGETVAIGTPLFVVADLSRLRVDAEVDELDALRVIPGMVASVSVDGAPGGPIVGSVEDVGLAVGPRALRPQDPARPTDAQIFHVFIGLESATRLKLGQRVTVSLTEAPPGS